MTMMIMIHFNIKNPKLVRPKNKIIGNNFSLINIKPHQPLSKVVIRQVQQLKSNRKNLNNMMILKLVVVVVEGHT